MTGDQAVSPAAVARAALAAVVADPELGPDALADPDRMASLLSDYLPDAPAAAGGAASRRVGGGAGDAGGAGGYAAGRGDPAGCCRDD